MMRIAIVIGHNVSQPGAVRVTDGISEFVWNGALAATIQSLAPENVRVFRRERAGGYNAEVRAVYAQVDAWGADVSCELHFNGAADARATGTETLYASDRGKVFAERVNRAMVAALGLRDRGEKKVARTDRGGESLYVGRAPAILVEPYFGSNANDCNTADVKRDALARAILAGLLGAAVSAPVAPTKPSDLTIEQRLAELEMWRASVEARGASAT